MFSKFAVCPNSYVSTISLKLHGNSGGLFGKKSKLLTLDNFWGKRITVHYREKKRFLCTFDFFIFWYELCLRDFAWQTKIRMKFIFECVRLYKLWLFRGTGWKILFFLFYLCLFEPFIYHKFFFTFDDSYIQY